MINAQVKAQLLESITNLVQRIMDQAGMKENEVRSLIGEMLAQNTPEGLAPTITDKLITPQTAHAVAVAVLKENIGSAPDEYNTIEKLGLAFPELLEQVNAAISDAVATLAQSLSQVTDDLVELVSLLTNNGILAPVEFNVSVAGSPHSINMREMLTLADGSYLGFVNASHINLTGHFGTVDGLDFDERVLLHVTQSKVGAISNIKRAHTSKGQYTCTWLVPIGTSIPETLPPFLTMYSDWRFEGEQRPKQPETSAVHLLSALRSVGHKSHPTQPNPMWPPSTVVEVDTFSSRDCNNEVFLWVYSDDVYHRWVLITDARMSAGHSGDTEDDWIARGATILGSGSVLDLTHPDNVLDQIEWKLEPFGGMWLYSIHEEKGTKVSTSYGLPSVLGNAFSIGLVNHLSLPNVVVAANIYGLLTVENKRVGTTVSRDLALSLTVDRRLPSPVTDGVSLGTFDGVTDESRIGKNDLVKKGAGAQAVVRVFKYLAQNTPMVGVAPDGTDFNVPSGNAAQVSFGAADTIGMPLAMTCNVTYEFSYGGSTRKFKVIMSGAGKYVLREIITDVLTGSDYEHVTSIGDDMTTANFTIKCGKDTEADISQLEQMFSVANDYVPAKDILGGQSYFAHTGALDYKIKVQSVADDSLIVELAGTINLNA